MNASDLDLVYTHACNRMTELGRENTELFLSRLVVLAFARELERDAALQLIDDAARNLETLNAPATSTNG